jgi:hypothetical protein
MYNTLRLCFLTICITIFTVIIKSQTILGLQGGLNISNLAGHKNYDENKLRIGVSAYVYGDFSLGNFSILSIESGLAISQQGMTNIKYIDNIGSKTTLTVKNKLDYIFVPVYLRENLTNFYTKIGPYFGYLVNAQSKLHEEKIQSFKTIHDSTYYDTKFVQNISKYDLGLSFGIGYVYYFQPGPGMHRGRGRSKLTPVILIDFRYNIGLLKIGTSKDLPNMNLRNQVFTLGITLSSVRN